MAGGIPSGSDPSGWEAGTVGSNPAQGFDPTATAGVVVGTGATVSGQISGVTAGISNLINRTQDVITSAYQELVQADTTLTSYSDQVFAGLSPDGTTPLPLLIVQALASALGLSGELATMESALGAFESWAETIPGAAEVSQLGTEMTQLGQIFDNQVVTPISEAVSEAQTGFSNVVTKLTLMLRTPNLVLDPDFEVAAMWSNDAGTQTTNESHSGIYSWQLVGQG
jgi:hypothetical protein